MGPKILITGGSGYVGGTLLNTLLTRHPEYDITAFLRTVPENLGARYPHLHTAKGDYDDEASLTAAVAGKDIVVHMGSSDHVPAVKALLAGLRSQQTANSPKFFVHLSGSGIIADFLDPTFLGRLNPRVWSDVTDVDTLTSLPEDALHRPVDKVVQEAHSDMLKTAIVCPPDIYGYGTGPGKNASIYLPQYVKEIKAHGGIPFYTVTGENARGWVHVEDLAHLFERIVEDAVSGGAQTDWGKDGYYFAATQTHSQREIAQWTAEILQRAGLLDTAKTANIPLDVVDKMVSAPGRPHRGTYFFASNARTRADRAKKIFGWGPTRPSFREALEDEILRFW